MSNKFEFETHCFDGHKCGATTTGCLVGKCQRKSSPQVTYLEPILYNQNVDVTLLKRQLADANAQLSALQADAQRWQRYKDHAWDDFTDYVDQVSAGTGGTRQTRAEFDEQLDEEFGQQEKGRG